MEPLEWQTLEEATCGTDYTKITNELQASAESMFKENLKYLENDFQGEQEKIFFQAFIHAYWETYYKRCKNKQWYWSAKSLILPVIGTGGSGIVVITSACTVFSSLLSSSSAAVSDSGFFQLIAFVKAYGIPCLILVVAALIMAFSITCLKAEVKRRDYRGTWVRHSVTYHNLNLMIIRYLSGLLDKNQFMEKTLEVLGNNVERFAYNSKTKLTVEGKDESTG